MSHDITSLTRPGHRVREDRLLIINYCLSSRTSRFPCASARGVQSLRYGVPSYLLYEPRPQSFIYSPDLASFYSLDHVSFTFLRAHSQRPMAYISFHKLWTPPPNPEKPACPYRVGFQVEIRPHTPPLPFGDRLHGQGAWRERSDVDLKSVTQTKLVISYPPLEREDTWQSSTDSPTAILTIT